MLGPAQFAGLEILRGYDFDSHNVCIDAIDKADLVVIQRDFCRYYDPYCKLLSAAHAQGKPVILDLDDNLFVMPPDHPHRINGDYVDSLLPTLQAVMDADLVTVATNPLRGYLVPYNANIKVIPNYLDDSLWKISPPAIQKGEDHKVTIGFMGGHTHKPDLELVTPVLSQLQSRYHERISFHFWGIDAPDELAPYSQVDWYPLVYARYDEFVAAFQSQTADIMVAPLRDNLFNSCKSPIKYLEYSALGVAGVYSRVAPFADIVDHGKDGFLATTSDEWMEGLVKLIESPELRRELAINAQQKITQDWLLSTNVAKRVEIYTAAMAGYSPKVEDSSSFYQLEKSLTEQHYEEQQREKERYSALNAQLEVNAEHIKELENEVLSYVTSHSWNLTRPLRAFMRFIRRFWHA